MDSFSHGRHRRAIISIIVVASTLTLTILLLHNSPADQPNHIGLETRHPANDNLASYSAPSLVRRQVEQCDWDTIEQTSQRGPGESLDGVGGLTYCEKKYIEGQWLQCMLNDDSDTHWASLWTDTSSLRSWGWDTRVAQGNDLDRRGFDAAFWTGQNALGLDLEGWISLAQQHRDNSRHDGKKYPATKGSYYNFFNSEYNAIAALSNYSPDFKNSGEDNPLPANQITKLKNWSDLVALGLKQYGEQNHLPPDFMRDIEHVFRHHILNGETENMLKMAFDIDHASQIPTWPGNPLTENDPRFSFLLASPNARGVAWLLGQHKELFGAKVITHIVAFQCEDIRRADVVCMYFRVADQG